MVQGNDAGGDGVREAPLYVIGHKNPDTDAICSAIGYAEYLRRTGHPEAVAACCGAINPRTKWVLEHAGVEAPVLVMDVRPTAEGICQRQVVLAHEDDCFLTVYHRMKDAKVRSIPVVDADHRVMAMPTVQDLLELLLHSTDARPDEARRVLTSLRHAAETLGGEIVTGRDLDREQDFFLTVSASSEEAIIERIQRFSGDDLMILVGDRPRIHDRAVKAGVRAMILTSGARLTPDLEEEARAGGVTVICTSRDTASTLQLVRCSRRVGSGTRRDFLSVPCGTLVSSLPGLIADAPQQALFPVVSGHDGRLIGVFSKSDLLEPPRQRLVLVDHNEFSQAVTGAADCEVVEVLDHHRLSGNLVSREPVRFINEPVGSTSTIVGRSFRQAGLVPERGTAICLCAGLISDTLHLKSPTTTDTDREVLAWLAEGAGLDLGAFAREFFAAGSMLRTWPAAEMIGSDRKEYHENGWDISISQIEELSLEDFPRRRAELQEALEAWRQERGLDHASLVVTDISSHVSLLLVSGDPEITQRIDYPEVESGVFRMDGVVSRKKQFFPYMSRVLGKARRMATGAG